MSYGKRLTDLIKELEKIAAGDCSCTNAQCMEDDPTLCRTCQASHILNEIGEDARYGLEELKKMEKDQKESTI